MWAVGKAAPSIGKSPKCYFAFAPELSKEKKLRAASERVEVN